MLVSPQEGYRHWAATYDESPNPIVALETGYLSERLSGARGQRVIDVGCGTGRWLGEIRGVGIDAAREMLLQSKAVGRVAQGDALRLPFVSGIADVVLCALSLAYLRPARAALEEMRRVARIGGQVIVTDVHWAAARRGWKHSFRSSGLRYEIENTPYTLDELSVPGLTLEDQRDLFFGEPERRIFEQAGKSAYFEEACRIPAVWMLRWRVVAA
jgi:SAM-dependent methyltransferase